MVVYEEDADVYVLDLTDPANPREIAFFDRGPVDGAEMVMGGSWSVYWYNGRIYSSEISRGLDVLEAYAGLSGDPEKVRALAGAVTELAGTLGR